MSTTAAIVKTPDVLHGNPRIDGTRIGVFQVGELVRQQGWTRDAVAEQFDLDEQQVKAALTDYDDHPELIETLRAQHQAGIQSIAGQSRL